MLRSGFEIRADILSQVKNGVELPTKIGYTTNCNWTQLGFYLNEFVEQGLVECSVPVEGEDMRKKKRYRITEKGEIVLSCLNEVRRLVGIESLV